MQSSRTGPRALSALLSSTCVSKAATIVSRTTCMLNDQQDGFQPWPGEEQTVWTELGRDSQGNAVKQTVLDLPLAGEIAVTNMEKANVKLESGQDHKAFYPSQEQAIWPKFMNEGPATASNLILESPKLATYNLSIIEVYGNCPQTDPNLERIWCNFTDVKPNTSYWSKITLKYNGLPGTAPLELPLTLTSYVGSSQSDSKKYTHSWHRRAPLEYQQKDISKFPQPREFTVSAVPSAEDERKRLKQQFKWIDFQPTGFYLNPNKPLTVAISGVKKEGPIPQILIGTPDLVHPSDHNDYMPLRLHSMNLTDGDNMVSNPLGGILYIRYTKKDSQNAPDIKVKIEKADAAQPFPFFQKKDDAGTTERQWLDMLNDTNVPFAEVNSSQVVITGLAKNALFYARQDVLPNELVHRFAEIIAAQNSISALDASASDFRDKTSHLRPMVVQTSNKDYANSFDYRIAIPVCWSSDVWNKTELRQSWMIWHELGHQREHSYTWSWSALVETTVNIYSLAARRLFPDVPSEVFGHATISEWEEAKKYLTQTQKNFDQADHFVQLVMFEQLREAFGNNFYHQLHKDSRRQPNLNSDADMKHYFFTKAAQLAEQSLIDYFEKWGNTLENRTKEEIKKQPDAKKDYSKIAVYGGRPLGVY